MGALFEQLRLEWRCQRRRPFVWFCFAGYFVMAFGDTYRTGLSATGNEWINGGSMISLRAIIYSVLGVIVVAGVVAEPMCRDRVCRTQGQILSAGAGRWSIGIGRFLVAFAIAVVSAAMFIPGTILGSMMPGIPQESIGPLVMSHYTEVTLGVLIPNFLLTSALVFVVASRWQSQAVAYAAAVAGVALWVTTRMLLGRDVYRQDVFSMYALLDPYGTIAQAQYAIGWSVAQHNQRVPPLQGLLLYNRLIWSGISFVLIAAGVLLIPQRQTMARSRPIKDRVAWRRRLNVLAPAVPTVFMQMVAWELRVLWRHPGAKICLGFAAFSLWWTAASAVTHLFSLPSTDLLVHNTGFYFDKILVLVLVWAAADLLWRERTLDVSELIDAQPTAELSRYASKTIALLMIAVVFWTLSILVNVAYQIAHGYYYFELGLYLTDTFVFKIPFYLWLAVLALAVQAVVRQRFVAMGIVLVVYLSDAMFLALDWRHPLLRYGRVSFFWYSLMDGYGHFWRAHLWFLLYWTLGAAAVWMIGYGCYGRGINPAPRLWLLRRRLGRGIGLMATVTFLLLLIGVGSYIWLQSTVKAPWPPIDPDKVKAEIEKKYREVWRPKAQPIVVGITGEMELVPDERRFRLTGTFILENQDPVPINEVLVLAEPTINIEDIGFGEGAKCLNVDEELNIQHWSLGQPIQPGDRITMHFVTSGAPPEGFAVHVQGDGKPEVLATELVGNGTSVLNLQMMPAVGYTDRVEHKPTWKRRRLGLPPQWQAPSGEEALRTAHATFHTGWVELIDMKITTSADQIALHAGKLIAVEDQPDGRRTFHYRVDRPGRGWSQILTARYAEKRFSREGIPDVVLYHDPLHTFTLDAMGSSLQDAIEHFADRYGSPPFETYRMAEQSLHYDGLGSRAGMGHATEILGWKTDLQASKGEDLHTLAAQLMGMTWFGDQLIPANVAGAKIIHSGLPYWSAALYLHQRRDADTDRRLRLQASREMFHNRGEMVDQEAPFNTEFKDSGMIRKKGSVQILYLAKLVGAEQLERILGEFLDRYRYQPPPYPTAEEFIEHLRRRIDERYHPQIADIFERVALWRLSVRDATVRPTPDGRWELRATVDAQKVTVTGWGEEHPAELNTPIELAAFRGHSFAETDVISSRIESLPSGESEVTMILDEPPTRFGIDPYLYLPDPNVYDNILKVERSR